MRHPKSYDTTPETSRRMGHIRLKRGKAESALAKALWHKGYRYRLNDRRLPGSPDIAVAGYKLAVFVDGEFWHGYDWERRKGRLKANREYWIEKIEENIARDRRNDLLLQELGWLPVHFWEREIKRDLPGCVRIVEELGIQRRVEEHMSAFPEQEDPDGWTGEERTAVSREGAACPPDQERKRGAPI